MKISIQISKKTYDNVYKNVKNDREEAIKDGYDQKESLQEWVDDVIDDYFGQALEKLMEDYDK